MDSPYRCSLCPLVNMDGLASCAHKLADGVWRDFLHLWNVHDVPLEHHLPLGSPKHGKACSAHIRPYQHLCHDCLFLHSCMRWSDRRMARMAGVRFDVVCGSCRDYGENLCLGLQSPPLACHLSYHGMERSAHFPYRAGEALNAVHGFSCM